MALQDRGDLVKSTLRQASDTTKTLKPEDQYISAAILHRERLESGDVKASNAAHDRLIAAAKEIRKHSDLGRSFLLGLLTHADEKCQALECGTSIAARRENSPYRIEETGFERHGAAYSVECRNHCFRMAKGHIGYRLVHERVEHWPAGSLISEVAFLADKMLQRSKVLTKRRTSAPAG